VAQALYQNPDIPVNPAHRISPGVGQGGVKPLLSEKQIEHDIGIMHVNKALLKKNNKIPINHA
jgi:hypothetical protein